MAYDNNELERCRQYVKEIIDEQYFSALHEMRKNMTIARSREQECLEKLEKCEKELKQYEQCHDCHNINVEKRTIGTQTEEIKPVVQDQSTELEESGSDSSSEVTPEGKFRAGGSGVKFQSSNPLPEDRRSPLKESRIHQQHARSQETRPMSVDRTTPMPNEKTDSAKVITPKIEFEGSESSVPMSVDKQPITLGWTESPGIVTAQQNRPKEAQTPDSLRKSSPELIQIDDSD